jgi:hypothetical protein
MQTKSSTTKSSKTSPLTSIELSLIHHGDGVFKGKATMKKETIGNEIRQAFAVQVELGNQHTFKSNLSATEKFPHIQVDNHEERDRY